MRDFSVHERAQERFQITEIAMLRPKKLIIMQRMPIAYSTEHRPKSAEPIDLEPYAQENIAECEDDPTEYGPDNRRQLHPVFSRGLISLVRCDTARLATQRLCSMEQRHPPS
jgi:hypothetical protein